MFRIIKIISISKILLPGLVHNYTYTSRSSAKDFWTSFTYICTAENTGIIYRKSEGQNAKLFSSTLSSCSCAGKSSARGSGRPSKGAGQGGLGVGRGSSMDAGDVTWTTRLWHGGEARRGGGYPASSTKLVYLI